MNMSSVFDPHKQHHTIENKIIAALERVSEAFRVLLWQEAKEYSLSPIQLQILIFLYFRESSMRTITYLAKEFNMTKPTISDAVRVLVEKKYLNKIPDPNDSRSSVLTLTAKGIKAAEQISLFANQMRKPLKDLSDRQKKAMLEGLYDLIHKLNKAGIITIQRMCHTCRFYVKKSGGVHYCNLLKVALETSELRIDCPEHEPVILS